MGEESLEGKRSVCSTGDWGRDRGETEAGSLLQSWGAGNGGLDLDERRGR